MNECYKTRHGSRMTGVTRRCQHSNKNCRSVYFHCAYFYDDRTQVVNHVIGAYSLRSRYFKLTPTHQ